MATIDGLKEMLAGFEELGKQILKNEKNGVMLAGNAYKNDVQALAPHKTGDYIKSIHVEPSEEGGHPIAIVGTNRVDAKQHEFGGVIKAKNKPFLVFKTDDGAWHKVKQVTQPAHPHFRPPLDQNAKKYQDIILEELAR